MTSHFTLIIAGENPDELIKKYSSSYKVEPYLAYEYSKAKEYHEKHIKIYEEALKKLDGADNEYIKQHLEYLKSIDDIDFYLDITEGFDIDDETGDAYTTSNPDCKYDYCKPGKNLSMPLINKKGEETFSETKENIDWDKIHLNNKYVYEFVWDSIVEGTVKPNNEDEQRIYDNMKNRKAYFKEFKDRDTYVISNTAFWGYAFLSEETGWVEMEKEDQFNWVCNFFDIFVKPLNDKTRISVYECMRL